MAKLCLYKSVVMIFNGQITLEIKSGKNELYF